MPAASAQPSLRTGPRSGCKPRYLDAASLDPEKNETRRKLVKYMSATVADLLKLPSLRQAKVLCGLEAPSEIDMQQSIEMARQCADIVIGASYDGNPVMSLSTPHSLQETERAMETILRQALLKNPNAVLVRCGARSSFPGCKMTGNIRNC